AGWGFERKRTIRAGRADIDCAALAVHERHDRARKRCPLRRDDTRDTARAGGWILCPRRLPERERAPAGDSGGLAACLENCHRLGSDHCSAGEYDVTGVNISASLPASARVDW